MSVTRQEPSAKPSIHDTAMPDVLAKTAGVAVIPCYNEGRNPIDLCAALLAVPDLRVVFVDDGSDETSRDALKSLEQFAPRVVVLRNVARIGKVASLLNVLRSLDPAIERILTVDCDVVVEPAALDAVLRALDRADLVFVNAVAMPRPRTLWERGAIFSARRNERLRSQAYATYPALCCNGRLLGMSRRLVDAIVRSDVPRHTEDAHFMLVALAHGFPYAYLPQARPHYRAPDTLRDYLRQSNRFSEGRALLHERWPAETLTRYYDPRPYDLLRTLLAQGIRDPLGALAFLAMLAAKALQPKPERSEPGDWAVATSTKTLKDPR